MLAETPESQLSEIILSGGLMLLFALGSLACVVIVSFFASRVSAALSMRLRDMLFSKVGAFSMEEFSHFSSSSLIARSTNDITQIQQFTVMALQMLLKVPILTIGGILGIAGNGVSWTVATLIGFGFVLAVVVCAITATIPQFSKMQNLVDKLNLLVKESLTGRTVIRAFNAKKYHEKKFEETNEGFTNTDQRTGRTMAIMSPVMSLGTNGIILAIYIIGAFIIISAEPAQALVTFSSMVVMTFYLALLFTALKFITKVLPRIPRVAVSAKRILEVLETMPVITGGTRIEAKPGCNGEITFKNVGFKYPGASANALEDVSFTIKPGETTAIIGSTGSGKTTLVHLVMRFFDAVEGEVRLGGVNIKEYELNALYNLIGYVPQSATLFKGTVSSNITYGENGTNAYSKASINHALQIAQATEFVSTLEDGMNAPMSQRGANFSGGQKQRLSIARAMYRNPEILIFDDSFSALDYKTDREVRDAIKRSAVGVTKLIVAQRIGTIMDADNIIVLDEGRLVGSGTHGALLESCQIYQEIAASQL